MIEPQFDATRLAPVAKPLQALSQKFFAPRDAQRNKAAEKWWAKNPENPEWQEKQKEKLKRTKIKIELVQPSSGQPSSGQKAYRTRAVNAFKTAHDAFYKKDKKGNFTMTKETHPMEYTNMRQLWDKAKQLHSDDAEGFKSAMGNRRPHLPPRIL